ncbi:MAG TPA: helix-turn-helix domain-containing protein [Gaiellaceae bacterium]|nr:helix-turn-helix domain-containing protein [Gaiellaceae bacterium]
MSVPGQQLSLPLFDPQPPGSRQEPAAAEDTTPCPAEPPAVDEAQVVPGLLTTNETAVLLHVHPRTVQRLVERGQLEAIHLGTAVRFDPGDVAALTEREKQRAAAAPATLTDRVRAARDARVSFAERLRSRQHEHRAAQA